MKSGNVSVLPDLLADIAVAVVRHAGWMVWVIGKKSYIY